MSLWVRSCPVGVPSLYGIPGARRRAGAASRARCSAPSGTGRGRTPGRLKHRGQHAAHCGQFPEWQVHRRPAARGHGPGRRRRICPGSYGGGSRRDDDGKRERQRVCQREPGGQSRRRRGGRLAAQPCAGDAPLGRRDHAGDRVPEGSARRGQPRQRPVGGAKRRDRCQPGALPPGTGRGARHRRSSPTVWSTPSPPPSRPTRGDFWPPTPRWRR